MHIRCRCWLMSNGTNVCLYVCTFNHCVCHYLQLWSTCLISVCIRCGYVGYFFFNLHQCIISGNLTMTVWPQMTLPKGMVFHKHFLIYILEPTALWRGLYCAFDHDQVTPDDPARGHRVSQTQLAILFMFKDRLLKAGIPWPCELRMTRPEDMIFHKHTLVLFITTLWRRAYCDLDHKFVTPRSPYQKACCSTRTLWIYLGLSPYEALWRQVYHEDELSCGHIHFFFRT